MTTYKSANDLYFIKVIRDVHPGTGTSETGTIDLKVQRDHNSIPMIRRTGIKGAWKEHLIDANLKPLADSIFGSEGQASKSTEKLIKEIIKELNANQITVEKSIETKVISKLTKNRGQNKSQPGTFSVTDARMLFFPTESNLGEMVWVTCPMLLKNFSEDLRIFFDSNSNGANYRSEINNFLNLIEEEDDTNIYFTAAGKTENRIKIGKDEIDLDIIQEPYLNGLLYSITENNFAIISDLEFKVLVDDFHLPIEPHINIKNGKSDNLWYEQVIPWGTIFYNSLHRKGTVDEINSNTKKLNDFMKSNKNRCFQVGARLTTGYGFCLFEKHEAISTDMCMDQNSLISKDNE